MATKVSSQGAGRGGAGARRGRYVTASGRLGDWRSLDLVTCAMLGVAFGVVFWAWNVLLYPLISAALVFPPLQSLTLGVWVLPAVVGALVVRRPGAAVFTEIVAASVEAMLGNGWGWLVLVSGGLQGLGVEVAFLLFAWRRFGPEVAMLGGALAGVFELVGFEWWVYQAEYAWEWRFVALGAAVISGALIAGLGGWLVTRALTATGALDSFPPGREQILHAEAPRTGRDAA